MSGYNELRSSAAILNLSEQRKLRLTGDDCARLLHAMCTNDIEHLEPGRGVYAFFLSAQGRILADANIFNCGGTSLLIDTGEATLAAHLDKYIIADDVTIDDLTNSWTAVAIEGPDTPAAAERAGLPVPREPLAIAGFENGFVARVSSAASDGVRIYAPAEEHAKIMAQLQAAGLPEATEDEAQAVRLENGLPRYGSEISDRYLVHETQQLHGVHFNKGCYIGQEIVERVRSRGQVHRLLTAVALTGTKAALPGTKVLAAGKEVGEITSTAWSPALNQVIGFAYLRGEGLDPASKLTVEVNSVAEQASIRL